MKLPLKLLLLLATSFSAVAQSASVPESQDKQQDKQVDPYLREYNDRRAKNPEGLLFTVRLKENRKQFQHGEVIALELSFASAKPETLTLDAATYDRSGRLHSDGFALDPRDGAVDPIADYFSSGLDFFMIGGIRGIPDLTEKPHLITVELNEWQRIHKPGRYRMYVVSSRVGRKGGQGIFLFNGGSPVVSNVIEFEILPPDQKWARQKLTEALSTLDKPGSDRNAACKILRFLGTTAAATEMRKRFRGDDDKCEWEYKFGLIGSPHRDFVIRDMENAISLREQPVTSHFISTLSLLVFTKRAGPPPPYVGDSEEQFKQRQVLIDKRRSVYDELRLHYLRQLVIAVPQKQGQARATSLQTLLDNRSELNAGDLSQWSTLLAALPDVFNRLSLDDQLRLLQYQWKPIASATMLPVLREVFNYSYKPANNSQPQDLFDAFRQEDLRSIALRRLNELSPDEGRRLILAEIRRPKLRVNVDVLRLLPDETLPELNTVLLANFEEARRNGNWYSDGISELMERYATDEILPRVRAIYESQSAGMWNCRTQAALLAYFFRVAPATAGEYLNKALTAKDRGYAGCFHRVLKDVAELHMSPEVEEVATAALDNADSAVVSQAASVLADYGSADAEKALWRRLEKWNEEATQTRSAEVTEQKLTADQEKIEKELRQALTSAQAWLSDPEKLKRVRDLCLTEESRAEVDRMITGWDPQIYVAFNSYDDETLRLGVANYQPKSLNALKKKLLQFPKGTVFKFKTTVSRGDESKADEVFQQLKTYLEGHGMKLRPAPAND